MHLKQNDSRAGIGTGPQAGWAPPAAGRKARQIAAYSLAEVMVAVFVLGVIGLAYYSALSSGFSVVQSTREDLRATQIMMQKIEAIRLCTWSQLTNFTFQETYDPLSTNNNGTVYTGSVAIGPATALVNNPSYSNNMCLVTVTLGWTNYNGRRPVPHTRKMQTEVARYGLQNYVWGAQ
jgi:hypothetical protein